MALPVTETILEELDAKVGAVFWQDRKMEKPNKKEDFWQNQEYQQNTLCKDLKLLTTAEGVRLNLLQEKPTHFS